MTVRITDLWYHGILIRNYFINVFVNTCKMRIYERPLSELPPLSLPHIHPYSLSPTHTPSPPPPLSLSPPPSPFFTPSPPLPYPFSSSPLPPSLPPSLPHPQVSSMKTNGRLKCVKHVHGTEHVRWKRWRLSLRKTIWSEYSCVEVHFNYILAIFITLFFFCFYVLYRGSWVRFPNCAFY